MFGHSDCVDIRTSLTIARWNQPWKAVWSLRLAINPTWSPQTTGGNTRTWVWGVAFSSMPFNSKAQFQTVEISNMPRWYPFTQSSFLDFFLGLSALLAASVLQGFYVHVMVVVKHPGCMEGGGPFSVLEGKGSSAPTNKASAPLAQNQYMHKTVLEELTFSRIHVGPVFALCAQEETF